MNAWTPRKESYCNASLHSSHTVLRCVRLSWSIIFTPCAPANIPWVPMVPLGPAMTPVQRPRVMVTIANDHDILGGREIACYSSEQFFPWWCANGCFTVRLKLGTLFFGAPQSFAYDMIMDTYIDIWYYGLYRYPLSIIPIVFFGYHI